MKLGFVLLAIFSIGLTTTIYAQENEMQEDAIISTNTTYYAVAIIIAIIITIILILKKNPRPGPSKFRT